MNDFIDKFNSYPLGQRVLVLIIIMTAIYGIYHVLYDMPTSDEIASKQNQLVKAQRDKEKFDQLIKNMNEVQRKREQLSDKIRVAKGKLPPNSEIPSLLQLIHNQAKTAGLDIEVFQREPDAERDYYYEIPVTMELIGTYDELANFFYYVGRMTRIVNVKNIALVTSTKRGGPKTSPSTDGELKVTALATTFRYKAQKVESGSKGDKKKKKKKSKKTSKKG